MNAPDSPRVGVDVYLEWLQREAVPVTEDFGVDLLKVPTARWDRYARPAELPKYGVSAFPTVWWWDADKASKATRS